MASGNCSELPDASAAARPLVSVRSAKIAHGSPVPFAYPPDSHSGFCQFVISLEMPERRTKHLSRASGYGALKTTQESTLRNVGLHRGLAERSTLIEPFEHEAIVDGLD
jgi:hypothetical protein